MPLLSRCEKIDRIWSKSIKLLNLQLTTTLKIVFFYKKYGILHVRQDPDKTKIINSSKNDATRGLHSTKHSPVWYKNGCFCDEFYLKSDSTVSYKGRTIKCYVFLDDQSRISRLNLVYGAL